MEAAESRLRRYWLVVERQEAARRKLVDDLPSSSFIPISPRHHVRRYAGLRLLYFPTCPLIRSPSPQESNPSAPRRSPSRKTLPAPPLSRGSSTPSASSVSVSASFCCCPCSPVCGEGVRGHGGGAPDLAGIARGHIWARRRSDSKRTIGTHISRPVADFPCALPHSTLRVPLGAVALEVDESTAGSKRNAGPSL